MRTKLFTCLFFIAVLFSFTSSAQNYIINTIAGKGLSGNSGNGGPADSAELWDPTGIAFDDSGNLYIADYVNDLVHKVNTRDTISIFAGTGTTGFSGDGGAATAAGIWYPFGVALDDTGNVYFADRFNERVRKVNTKGIITTLAGNGNLAYSGDGGPATAAALALPEAVAADDTGNIYIVDVFNNLIRKVNTKGIISTVAGSGVPPNNYGYSGDGGAATAAQLDAPNGITIDSAGNMYIADAGNNAIRKVTKNGIISTIAGNGYGAGSGQGVGGYSGDGGAATLAELYYPEGVAVDDSGNVYIADFSNNVIRKVNTAGIISTIAGTGTPPNNYGYNGDGIPATTSELWGPSDVIVDKAGNIYIADETNNRVRELTKACSITASIYPPSASICIGQTVILSVKGNGTTYDWSPVAGLSATSGDSVVANPTATVTYTVTSSSGNCTTSADEVITIVPPPALIIKPLSPSVCPGQSVILSVPVSGSGYMWSPSSTLNSPTGDTVIASPSIQTTYTVTGTDSLGCVASASDVVLVSQAPSKPTILQNGDILTSSATQGNQWVRNDSIIQGATNQNYTIIISGWYQVIAKNPANGCSATSDSVYLMPTGILQLATNNVQLSIYPNPNNGDFTIQLQTTTQNMLIEIYNVLGEKIYKAILNPGNTDIKLSNPTAGIYLYRASDKEGSLMDEGKFIIE